VRFPEDIDVHQRLKSIYTDTQDKESAVTECIILNELYSRLGESENAEKALRDASEINPGDSRLAGREAVQFTGTDEFAVSQAGQQNIEDYEEEIAEADFYSRQGLTTEAVKILERLNRIFPENRNISERLKALGQSGYESEAGEMTGRIELPETAEPETAYREFEFPSEPGETEQAAEEEVGVQEEPQDTTVFKGFEDLESEAEQPVIERFIQDTEPAAEKVPEEKQELTAAPQKEQEFEEFTITEHDLTEAVEMPEPSLDNDVLEIFHEFKKGLEKELGDEDSETHYNLGIAYKEMGLVDDAIKEFQTSKNDPRKFIQSSTLLGVCYMEKGLYTLAIDILKKALDEIREKDEPYRAVQYDLAEAHEKNGDIKEAVELYTEVYGWNAKFRSVSDKMSVLRGQLPKADETARDKAKARKDRVSYL
jgi:tetratricopeptide (TPR) repeat protein